MIICPVSLKQAEAFSDRFQELEFLSLQGITAGTAVSGDADNVQRGKPCIFKGSIIKTYRNLHDEIVSGDDVFLLHSLKKKDSGKILWLESPEASCNNSCL